MKTLGLSLALCAASCFGQTVGGISPGGMWLRPMTDAEIAKMQADLVAIQTSITAADKSTANVTYSNALAQFNDDLDAIALPAIGGMTQLTPDLVTNIQTSLQRIVTPLVDAASIERWRWFAFQILADKAALELAAQQGTR